MALPQIWCIQVPGLVVWGVPRQVSESSLRFPTNLEQMPSLQTVPTFINMCRCVKSCKDYRK